MHVSMDDARCKIYKRIIYYPENKIKVCMAHVKSSFSHQDALWRQYQKHLYWTS